MMNFASGKRFAILAVLGAGLAACTSVGSTVSDDDPESEVPNSSMGRALMEGLGAVPARQTPINYSPRAALVVPPSTKTLAAPEDPNKVAKAGNWPVDPDVARNKMLLEADARDAGRDGKQQLSPNELAAVRLPESATANNGPRAGDVGVSEKRILRPSEIGNMPHAAANSLYDENGKPQRRALVEPPVAYLEPAAGTPVQPEEPAKAGTEKSFFNRLKFW